MMSCISITMSLIIKSCSLSRIFTIFLIFYFFFVFYEYKSIMGNIYENYRFMEFYKSQWSVEKNISNYDVFETTEARYLVDTLETDELVFMNVHNKTQKLSDYNLKKTLNNAIIDEHIETQVIFNVLTSESQHHNLGPEVLPGLRAPVEVNMTKNEVMIDERIETRVTSAVHNITNSNIIITSEIQNHNLCPEVPPGLRGPIEINMTKISLGDLEIRYHDVHLGGYYIPRNCTPKYKVAIIIPFRDRESHLPIFLNHMHPFLIKQQIEYQMYVIEQKGNGIFNKATIMNVGFVEAILQKQWDCFIFHDVDLLPIDDRNLYTCPLQPRHHSAAVNEFNFILPYTDLVGGALAMTTEQFKRVNGFSNKFWGWGCEDDDMANRIHYHNYSISRYPMDISRYIMLIHDKSIPSPNRQDTLMRGKEFFETDGLNNLQYKLVRRQAFRLYTHILVELDLPEQ